MTTAPPLTARRFLVTVLAVAAALLGGVGLINFTVDPYASFRWADIKGVTDAKTLRRDGGRVNKALILNHTRFDVLFFGSSRGEMGLDPDSPALDGTRAFNASLPYTSLYEMDKVVSFAAAHQSPRLVVVCLDLMMFVADDATQGDFARSGFAGAPLWPVYAQRLLSLREFGDSLGVLADSVRHIPQQAAKNGSYDRDVRRKGFDHRGEMGSLLRTLMAPGRNANSYGGFVYAPERMALVGHLATAFGDHDTRVALFIAPIHAKMLEAKIAAGLLPVYEQWERDLVATVTAVNAGRRGPVELWDFSGYNAVTTEDIPRDPSHRMQWYWDGSHFNKAAGNLVLSRILGKPAPEDFGTKLTVDTIGDSLTRLRQGHRDYAASHPDEMAEIAALAAARSRR